MEPTPQSQPDALSEGRRIYIGNLPYVVKPHNIKELLAEKGFGDVENIHISIDPVSARNPGYCFIDFTDRATAERVLTSFRASINGRPIKVGPCEPKKHRNRRSNEENKFAFERWGNWSSQSQAEDQGPLAAQIHFNDMAANLDGRRLRIGGLGKMINQTQHNEEVTQILANFKPTAIGKRITPHVRTRSMPGNHHYCFVDSDTKEEANDAMRALDDRPYTGGRLRVSVAQSIPQKLLSRVDRGRSSRRDYVRRDDSRPKRRSRSP